jgi:tryptophan-rich sensory protein
MAAAAFSATNRPKWLLPVVYTVAAVVMVIVGFASGMGANFQTVTRVTTPSAPPSAVFSVMWAILYAVIGCAVVTQVLASKTPAHWASLALLGATVVLAWAWPTIWSRAAAGALPGAAPVWVLGSMLLAAAPALALVPSSTTAALWAPYIAWLLCALGLALQQQARVKV